MAEPLGERSLTADPGCAGTAESWLRAAESLGEPLAVGEGPPWASCYRLRDEDVIPWQRPCPSCCCSSRPPVDELLEEVAEEHAERPAVMELQRAAVQGMLQWLETQDGSEHLRVLTRAEHERFQAYAQGERFGVGIGVLLVPGYGIRILEVFPGTPAEQAGLVPGEVVLAVGGVPVEQRSAVEVAAMLTARDREQLTLDLLDGQGVPRRVSLEPQRYRAPVLSTTEGEGYLLVRLHHFGAGAAEALAGVLERVGPRELVIDLRDARDGLLPEAVATAVGGNKPGSRG